jgi:hypothetical protein
MGNEAKKLLFRTEQCIGGFQNTFVTKESAKKIGDQIGLFNA